MYLKKKPSRCDGSTIKTRLGIDDKRRELAGPTMISQGGIFFYSGLRHNGQCCTYDVLSLELGQACAQQTSPITRAAPPSHREPIAVIAEHMLIKKSASSKLQLCDSQLQESASGFVVPYLPTLPHTASNV